MQDAKRRAIIFAVISLALALLAAILFMQRVSAVEAQLGNEVTVFVAETDIQPRQPLRAEQFKEVPIPEKFVQQSMVTSLHSVGDYGSIDQYVLIVPLKKGDVLSANLLKPAKVYGTDENKRLVYVPAGDRTVFDQPLEAQDRVDIIVSWGGNNAENRTVIFARDVLVAAPILGENNKFSGVWLEMGLNEAKKFIDAQNYAHSIRILKAPQKKSGEQVSVNQEIPDISRQNSGEQNPPGGNGSVPSNMSGQEMDLE